MYSCTILPKAGEYLHRPFRAYRFKPIANPGFRFAPPWAASTPSLRDYSLMRITLLVFATLVVAQTANSQFRSDSCGCPIPSGDEDPGSFGRFIPHFAEIQPHRSPDGRFMGYVTVAGESYIMELSSHATMRISVQARHAGEEVDYIYPAIWCPYDPDQVLVTVRSRVDTSKTGANPVSVFNIFKYQISSRASVCITPDTLGPYGALSKGALTFGASYWLTGSTSGNDSFQVGMAASVSPDHKQFWGVYVPQQQTLVRTADHLPDTEDLAVSSDSTHHVWLTHNSKTGAVVLPLMIDSTPLDFTVPLDTTVPSIQGASFSPGGDWVAYWVFPAGNGLPADTIFDQVWICPVSNPTKIEHVINFQRLYCTYSFWGIWPEFISDSTLAVSMHKDGDSVSALWEIGLDGHIVRQLTHVTAGVTPSHAVGAPELDVYPNPSSRGVTVMTLRPEILYVYNEAGQEVLRSRLGAGSSSVNTSRLPAGRYVFRTQDGEARVVIR
jgi:hypothetical protein